MQSGTSFPVNISGFDRRDCEFSFSGVKTAANRIIGEIDSAGVCMMASDVEHTLQLIIFGLFLVQRVAVCLLLTATTLQHRSRKQCFTTSWLGHTGQSSFPEPAGPASSTW